MFDQTLMRIKESTNKAFLCYAWHSQRGISAEEKMFQGYHRPP
jgi:hypothetical protein